jgi:hypothetical protein
MRRVFPSLLFVLVCAFQPLAAQTAAPVRSGVAVRGVVMAQNDAVLPRVRVVAVQPSTNRDVGSVMTDGDGRFVLDVPADTLQLKLTKAGYAARAMTLSRAEVLAAAGMQVRLARSAAVMGRVTDRGGEAAPLTRIVARRLLESGDTGITAPIEFQSDADDLGDYRIGGLPEGRYAVAPLPAGGRRGGTAPPSPPEPVIVAVRSGDELGDINFTVDVAALSSPAAPAPEAGEAGVIRGRVTSAGGQPVAGAMVRAILDGAVGRSDVTDAQGRYAVATLPPGSYRVEVSKDGYVTVPYAQSSTVPAGRMVAIDGDRIVDRIDLVLPRGSAIAGTVVDEYGEPLHDVAVDVLQVRSVAGRVRALRLRGRRTDDRGRYRVFGLLPGTYVVRVQVTESVANSDTAGYSPVYYPGSVAVEDAVPIAVGLGRDALNQDVLVRPTPAVRVSGVVLDSAGKPVRAGVAMIISERSGAIQVEPTTTQTAPEDGSFAIANVPPGDYAIQAFGAAAIGADGRPGPPQFAVRFVTIVDAAPPPLVLRMSPGATLMGRMTIEGQSSASIASASLVAVPADFDRAPMVGLGSLGFSVQEDGRFRYAGLTGPRRLALSSAPAGWYLKSAIVQGEDASERPFDFGMESATLDDAEIVLSASGATLSGRVTGERATAVTDYAVIVFAVDRARWFQRSQWLKTARPSQDGTFRVAGLPPGDYWTIAVDRLDGTPGGGEWQDAEVLQSLVPRATRVSVGESQTLALDLRLINR